MEKYVLALSIAFISESLFASSTSVVPEQNPLCPKTMTEEIYDQLDTGTYPGIQIEGKLKGMRHGNPGFKWEVPGLVLKQGNLHDLGNPEDLKNVCYYVEARSPKNNFVFGHLK